MHVEYKLLDSKLPSELAVWRMGRKMETDGHVVKPSVLTSFANGDARYQDGEVLKFCRSCVEYKPLDEFTSNKRHIFDKHYVCKECMRRNRRIARFGQPHLIVDKTFRANVSPTARVRLSEKNLELLNKLNVVEENNGEDREDAI